MSASPPRSRVPILCGLLGALLWSWCHVLIQTPRGWPSWELGEWDVMLVAEALLAGERVELGVGAIHGHELGSYLISFVLIPLRWLGLSSLIAAKVVATSIGAISTGLAVGTAAALGHRRADLRGAVLAAALVAVVASVAWPSWHSDLAGLNGRTPESALPTLAGGLLLLRWPLPDLRGLALGGFLLGIAWLFSPASIWMLGLAGLVAMAPGPAEVPQRLASLKRLPRPVLRTLVLLLCMGLPALLTALLLPGGFEGVATFLSKQVNQTMEALGGHVGTHPNSVGERGPLKALLAAPAILGNVAAPFEHPVPKAALGLVGWVVGGVCGLCVLSSVRRRRMSSELLLILAGLSFSIPLGLVAVDSTDLDIAARYYVVPLYFSIVASASWLAGLLRNRPRLGWLPGLALIGLALLPWAGLPDMVKTPAWTLEESLMNTGAHGLPGLSGENQHKAFVSLLHGAPDEGRRSFIEGYGMDLGGKGAFALWGHSPIEASWSELLPLLSPEERSSLLVGVGCGMARIDIEWAMLSFVEKLPKEQQSDIMYGLSFCVFDTSRTHRSYLKVSDEELARLSPAGRAQLEEGHRDATVEPPRPARRSTVGSPAERMRALPPLGERPLRAALTRPDPEAPPSPPESGLEPVL